jgi:hypothetical protein
MIDLDAIFSDKRLRTRFLNESGLQESALTELVRLKNLATIWPHLKATLAFWITCEHGTAGGEYGVYEWGGLYFAGSEWHGIHGPYATIQEACREDETLSLYLSEEAAAEVGQAKNKVRSILPDAESLELLRHIVHVGDIIMLNGVAYRRVASGYLRA